MENKETVFNTEIDKLIDSMDLTKEPPVKEPERQYWFMKKARQLVQEKEKELGRPLTACTVTFGCQMNSRDSEKLAGVLERIGYVETEDENADFVIYNTCTVRGKRQSKSLWKTWLSPQPEKEKPSYDDRSVRLYDAGSLRWWKS